MCTGGFPKRVSFKFNDCPTSTPFVLISNDRKAIVYTVCPCLDSVVTKPGPLGACVAADSLRSATENLHDEPTDRGKSVKT